MNAQSQKTVANCAELKIHIYECRKEPYLAAFYALVLNLGYGFFCGSLLFLINLSGSRVLGFAVLSAQHIISYLIRFKYLPFFISVFSNHGFSEDAGLLFVRVFLPVRGDYCRVYSLRRSACRSQNNSGDSNMKITFFVGLRHRLFNMLPYLAVSLLIWTICVLSSFGGERETFFSVFTEAVGGVEHSGQFDLFGFFRYFGTFFAGLFLGMAGSVLDSETMPYFVLSRSKSFFKWWIKTVSSALLWCVLYCLVGIAQAIMEDQQLLILDEPMNALDKDAVEEMRKLFLSFKASGKTMLIVSHNEGDISTLCDEVYEFDGARIKRRENV